jgi:sugar phosphate isomerase/epimerase
MTQHENDLRQYSLSFLTIADVSPVEAVKIAATCGYSKVGLRLLPAAQNEAQYPILTHQKLLNETQAVLKDTGVNVADVEIVRITPEFEPQHYLQFLDVAQKLNAKHILIAADDTELERLVQNFSIFCELSQQFGLSCDLEFMPWTAVKNLAKANEIVEKSGQENAAVLIDALHFDRSDSSFEQIQLLPASRMNYLQLCDGLSVYERDNESLIKTARTNRLVPGQGEIDLVSLIRALPSNLTLAAEVPNQKLSKLPAMQRAKINLEAMKQLVAQSEQVDAYRG